MLNSLKSMAKTCAFKDCKNDVFSHNYCKIHQWLRTDEKYLQYKERKKQGIIKPRSKKRAKDEKYYAVRAKEFFDDAVKNKTNHCFFCGEWVETFQGLHHLDKRDGSKLLNFDLIVICHQDCHDDYHFAGYERLSMKIWYNDFLNRLKLKSEELYNKEQRKREKVNKLHPKLEFEEEDI
jgi:hypothetical protein